MRAKKIIETLQSRSDWLTDKLVQMGDARTHSYHKILQEKIATDVSIDMFKRREEFRHINLANGTDLNKHDTDAAFIEHECMNGIGEDA